MHYRHPVSACAFDLVTRDANCRVIVRATSASGEVLHERALTVGPARSTWLRKVNSESLRARAIETVHCTTVRLVPASADVGALQEARTIESVVESETRTVVTLSLGPGDEMAGLSVAFHDHTTDKDDERALGLANIRVCV